jgi:hypothetical protein
LCALQVGQCFTILSRPEGSLAAGKIANVLKFKVKEIDPSSGEVEEDGYEDEYQVSRGEQTGQGVGVQGASLKSGRGEGDGGGGVLGRMRRGLQG